MVWYSSLKLFALRVFWYIYFFFLFLFLSFLSISCFFMTKIISVWKNVIVIFYESDSIFTIYYYHNHEKTVIIWFLKILSYIHHCLLLLYFCINRNLLPECQVYIVSKRKLLTEWRIDVSRTIKTKRAICNCRCFTMLPLFELSWCPTCASESSAWCVNWASCFTCWMSAWARGYLAMHLTSSEHLEQYLKRQPWVSHCLIRITGQRLTLLWRFR